MKLTSNIAPKLRVKVFTLIELLVVIAIIAILATILFPVFGRARENARRSSCQSNMKQLGLGLLQYSQDYDEFFPCGTIATSTTKMGLGWAGQVFPYVKSAQVYTWPNETGRPTAAAGVGKGYSSYSYNQSLMLIDTSTKDMKPTVAFTAPVRTVLLCESTNAPYPSSMENHLLPFKMVVDKIHPLSVCPKAPMFNRVPVGWDNWRLNPLSGIWKARTFSPPMDMLSGCAPNWSVTAIPLKIPTMSRRRQRMAPVRFTPKAPNTLERARISSP